MKVSGEEAVVRALEHEGCALVFAASDRFGASLRQEFSRSKVELGSAFDELSATLMAEGAARFSGKASPVLLSPANGLARGLAGIAQASADNVPLVALAFRREKDAGRAYRIHDLDQESAAGSLVKAFLTADTPEETYSRVREALRMAEAGAPGPVLVEIAADSLARTSTLDDWPDARETDESPAVSEEDLETAAAMLGKAKRPVLYLGNGARGAEEWLVGLAEALESPVVTTLQGKGVFPEQHPLWMWNGLGRHAPAHVKKALETCDLLLAIGCRFSESATSLYGFSPSVPLLHVDIDPVVPNRNFASSLAVLSDARRFAEDLMEKLSPRDPDEDLRQAISKGRSEELSRRSETKGSLPSLAEFLGLLERGARGNSAFTADGGRLAFCAAESLRLSPRSHLLFPVDFPGAGYAVPAALGALRAGAERAFALAEPQSLAVNGLELVNRPKGKAPILCVFRFQSGEIRDPGFSVEGFANQIGAGFLKTSDPKELEKESARLFEDADWGKTAVVELGPCELGRLSASESLAERATAHLGWKS